MKNSRLYECICIIIFVLLFCKFAISQPLRANSLRATIENSTQIENNTDAVFQLKAVSVKSK